MNNLPCLTSYPPPPASHPAIEGALSGGRPWITLRRAPNQPLPNRLPISIIVPRVRYAVTHLAVTA